MQSYTSPPIANPGLSGGFTRADLIELVGTLLPVDAPGDPRALIEQIVDIGLFRLDGGLV